MRDRSTEPDRRVNRPTVILAPADYDNVRSYIKKLEEDGATHVHKLKKEPKTKDKMDINNVYMLENYASRISSLYKIPVYTQDLMLLLWIRDYEYVSRTFITKTLGFPSHYASFKFMKRNVDNGFIKVVRTRHIGVHNGSAFYITNKGEELASRVYESLKRGNWEEYSH